MTPPDFPLAPRPSRRQLLSGGLAVMAGAALARPASAEMLETWPLGVQLWTVNAELQSDFTGTLKALKAAGYQSVETAGLHGRSPAVFRAAVEDAGLTCRSAHTGMGDLIESLDARIADALSLGARWLVCSSPKPLTPLDPALDWVAAMGRAMTLDAWTYNAGELARIAPEVARAGLRFAYHNHPMEFRDLNGTCGYDILLAAVPPDLLRLEMDLGWVLAAGSDPAATMKAHADRLELLHLKDMVKDPAAPTGYRSVEVGQGLINWPAVFAAASAIGVKGFFVEQEPPYARPALESLRMSAAYLKRL